MLPTTAASTDEGVIAFMNAAFGLRFAAFFAAAFFAAGFLAAVFFAAFFAVAMCLLPVGNSGRATPQRSEADPPVEARRSIGGDYTAFSQWRKGCRSENSCGRDRKSTRLNSSH